MKVTLTVNTLSLWTCSNLVPHTFVSQCRNHTVNAFLFLIPSQHSWLVGYASFFNAELSPWRGGGWGPRSEEVGGRGGGGTKSQLGSVHKLEPLKRKDMPKGKQIEPNPSA